MNIIVSIVKDYSCTCFNLFFIVFLFLLLFLHCTHNTLCMNISFYFFIAFLFSIVVCCCLPSGIYIVKPSVQDSIETGLLTLTLIKYNAVSKLLLYLYQKLEKNTFSGFCSGISHLGTALGWLIPALRFYGSTV